MYDIIKEMDERNMQKDNPVSEIGIHENKAG
jgi:hypothetical protein